MVHLNDRVKSIVTGHEGTIIDGTDTMVRIRFYVGELTEEVWYSVGSITRQPGYVQYAYVSRCTHSVPAES